MSVLLTTGDSIKALILARDFAKRGIGVVIGDKNPFSLASTSRYTSKSFQYSDPRSKPQEFIAAIKNNAKKNHCKVIIPTHSEDTYLVAKYKKELEEVARVPVHDYETLLRANDKGYVMKLASKLGIRTPKTIFISDIEEIFVISSSISYPAVIKLKDSKGSIGISYAQNPEQLASQFLGCVDQFNLSPSEYPIIQEYISGYGYGVSLLYNHGSLRARFTHKRLREYPPSGGPSTYRISVRHPDMEEMAEKILSYLGWHGVAMVEFKIDSRTKEPVLLEINPRFWGSVNQAIVSGVDFPYLLYKMAIDGDVEPVFDYKLGVKTRVVFIDFVTLIKRLRSEKSKVEIIKEFFMICPDDIMSLADPFPAMQFIIRNVSKIR